MTGAAHTFCVTEYAQTLLHTRKKKTERETTPEEVTIGLCRECKERKEMRIFAISSLMVRDFPD
jgi:hypothetical protein